MKLIFKIFLLIIFSKSSLLAETFNSALKRAYNTNPELNAGSSGWIPIIITPGSGWLGIPIKLAWPISTIQASNKFAITTA